MIKAIALDDEPPALEIIKSFCGRTEGIELVKAFTKTEQAFTCLKQFPVDLLFLDINMPSVSGIEFKQRLTQPVMVIFTTAHSEFAVEGFNLNAVDYLLKPFTYERFLQSVEKAKAQYAFLNQAEATQPDYLLLRVDYAMVKVPFSNIVFIEGLDDYIKIHQREGKPLVTRITMKTLAEKLPQQRFMRVHRSFIVPLDKVVSVRNKTITIGAEEIPIGSSYEEAFLQRFGGH